MSSADVPRDGAEAALAARQELGPEMEPAFAGGTVGLAGVLAVWIGIVIVNVAHALRR